ncbi:hypothetical protein EBL87_15300 [Cereibacter sphaeroides]|uniref:hypothetical protein n=1 Tax=Cereibacter sphaeroides TaxID=1063 RepID=UPI000F520E4C|nr:hypothetical protein [Cereibacter sphaeroides]AZB65040.1 hypothetical protein EBL87_15300 [Cereibacter sphaeroides]AZB67076.1 hypothetical protein EBL86_01110 [Cereibacter sphaeroides]
MNKLLLTAALIAAGTALSAETKAGISAATAAIDGLEIVASGEIMTAGMHDRFPMFREDDGGFYKIELALDRKSLAATKGCDGILTNCHADISAEIRVDGGDIKLIIFDVRNLHSVPSQ